MNVNIVDSPAPHNASNKEINSLVIIASLRWLYEKIAAFFDFGNLIKLVY